jgi:hypothetical protein
MRNPVFTLLKTAFGCKIHSSSHYRLSAAKPAGQRFQRLMSIRLLMRRGNEAA